MQRSQAMAHSRSASGLPAAKDLHQSGAEFRTDQSRREPPRRESGNWPRGSSPSPSTNTITNPITEQPISRGPQHAHDDARYLEFRDKDDKRETLDSENYKTDNDTVHRQRKSQLLSNIDRPTSPFKFSKMTPVIRSESLRSVHGGEEPPLYSPDGAPLASFRRRPLAKSAAGFQSVTSVELRSETNSKESADKRRNMGNASVQTDTPETDTRHSYAQTEYVTDSVSTTGSDVSDGHPNLDKSYELENLEHDHYMSHEEEAEVDISDNRSFEHYERKGAGDFEKQRFFPRRDDGKGESSTFSEFDSGVGNTVTRDRATYNMRTRYREPAGIDDNSYGLHSGQETSVRSLDAGLSQASMRVLIGVKPELVTKTVPLGNWVLLDAGSAGFSCVEPWATTVGVAGSGTATRRDFATQTFGQAMDSSGRSAEIQKQTEELPGKDFNRSTEVERNGGRISQPRQTEDKGRREARNVTKNDPYEGALTDEIIRAFKDTRQLIAEAAASAAQKSPKVENHSGTSELLKIMIRDVKTLKDRVKPPGPVENSSRKTERRNASFRRQSAGSSDSAIDTEEEEEENKRETEASRRRENFHRHEPGLKGKTETRRTERDTHGRPTRPKMATRGAVDRWRRHNDKENNFDHIPEIRRSYDPLRPNILTEKPSRYLSSGHPSRHARASLPRGPNVSQHAGPHHRPQDIGFVQNSAGFPNIDHHPGPYPWYPTQATYSTTVPEEQPHIQTRFPSGGNFDLRHPVYQYSGHEHMLPQNGDSHTVGPPVQTGFVQPMQPVVVPPPPPHQPDVVFIPTPQNPSMNLQPQGAYPGQIHPAPYGQRAYVPVQLPHQTRFVAPGRPRPTVGLPRRNKDPPSVVRPVRNRPSKQWEAEALAFEMSVEEAFHEAQKMKTLSNRLLKQLDFAV